MTFGLFCSSLGGAAEPATKLNAEMLLNDSRLWSQSGSAIVLKDFSKVEPASAITNGRREKAKWKVIPFATADFEGSALSTYAFTDVLTISLPLPAHGWHAISLGISTVSTGFREDKNGLQAKLSDEPVFKRMANNLKL